MIKWNFLKRLKPENESFTTVETKRIEIDDEEYIPENKPIAEYKETLHTSTKSSKKTNTIGSLDNEIRWRDVDSIEKKIDKLHITRAKKPTSEIDKTVDKVIQKQKKK